ncbi:MAG: iron-sulfur cluster repair di-iron protein [Deltaproteobacteria bacterium]|nr:iron-sulfur cluster repair di-iron protein [Deltaproteobacteria bacterium]
MSISPTTTVGEVARLRPATTRIFERARIDYCCGGGRTLAEACAKAGVDVAALVAELTVAPPDAGNRDWAVAPVPALIAHIVDTHHAFTRSEVDRAQRLATKVARVHGDRFPMLVELAAVVDELALELSSHLAKEEQILFPRILAGAGSGCGVDAPIGVMMGEHDEHGIRLARLASLTDHYTPPAEACGSWRALYDSLASLEADLHQHIHLENNVLFPRALGH